MSITKILEKGALAGLGLLTTTKEKTEKMVNDLVKKGEVSKHEGEKIIKDLGRRAKKAEKELNTRIEGETRKLIDKIGFVRKKEFEVLQKKLAALEKKLAAKK